MRDHPLDGFLQAFIGPRETREAPQLPAKPTVFKNTDVMEELDIGMSNCFHDIDAGFAEALLARPAQVLGRHAGWNFNGKVWFENGLFHEQVWCYRQPVKEISAPTLEELMTAVNDEFGAE